MEEILRSPTRFGRDLDIFD